METRNVSSKKQASSSSHTKAKAHSRERFSSKYKREPVRHEGKENRRSRRLKPLVGQPWPDEIEVEGEEKTQSTQAAKNSMILWIGALCGGLILMLTIYAMVYHDQVTLDRILGIAELGLGFIAVWATGKAALKVLGGWKEV
jgi:hypothetical protein